MSQLNAHAPTEFQPPNLNDVMTYRGIHVLGTVRVNDEGRMVLSASHYASCLAQGQYPLWGVWAATGKFLRFYSLKSEIAAAYPKLVWRRKMASWALMAVDDLAPAVRRHALADRYNAKLPKSRDDHDWSR